jgi:hypothetical protein
MVAGDPRSSAIAEQANRNAMQTSANKAMAGGKHKKKHRGGAENNTLVVPQFTMSYSPTGGPGSNPNDQVQATSQTSTQMAANSVYDKAATRVGGSRRCKRRLKGGNSDWNWSCYSGGKKSKRRHTRRNRKNKSRKHRK